ncbi:MAG: hypothetical protein OEX22_06490 [Cyclobacteriaceae bacterium]|nr:hypothetical protein [Cyclobacteriaceae bacterium]
MDSSFNKEAIKEYSQQYSDKVLTTFFESKTQISGEEMLKLTEVKQVNMFVLKLLFEAWQKEMDKIKSPYFDFAHNEVQVAFTNYKNTISRHILVNKLDFAPLFKQAVYETILIIVSPYHYFDEELNKYQGEVVLQALKNSKKFTKINQLILDAIINKLALGDTDFSSPVALLDAVLEETDLIPDDSTEGIENFNKVLQIDFNKIYIDKNDEIEKPIVLREENNDSITKEKVAQNKTKDITSTVDPQKNSIEEPIIEQKEKLDEQHTLLPSEETGEVIDNDESNKYNDVEEDVEPENNPFITLNDTFSTGEVKTLADIHEKQGVDKIETSITLNQRFMFVNGLFDGDVDTFNAVINTLDNLNNYEEAESYINSHFKNWDKLDEDVIEFFDILKKRFI